MCFGRVSEVLRVGRSIFLSEEGSGLCAPKSHWSPYRLKATSRVGNVSPNGLVPEMSGRSDKLTASIGSWLFVYRTTKGQSVAMTGASMCTPHIGSGFR